MCAGLNPGRLDELRREWPSHGSIGNRRGGAASNLPWGLEPADRLRGVDGYPWKFSFEMGTQALPAGFFLRNLKSLSPHPRNGKGGAG